MECIKHRSNCPISYALDIFGDKWSLLIIRDLMFREKNSYGDFLKSEEKIATNILANRLGMLECAGLITSRADKNNKARKLYRLTPKAIDLVPMIVEMIFWSATHDPHTAATPGFVERIKSDKKQLIAELVAHLNQTHTAAGMAG
jgi:DNA-binding HxlR family transcriptional regulator